MAGYHLKMLLVAVLFQIILKQSDAQDFGKSCLLNRDCKEGLACDIRTAPITNTCLYKLGSKCSRSADCVNNLSCIGGKCSCSDGTYYDADKNDCFDLLKIGQHCDSTSICLDICSDNVCLLDFGRKCSQDSECANNLLCLNGTCACNQIYHTADNITRDCILKPLRNEGKTCSKNSDCGNQIGGLGCDISVYGSSTYTCKRGLDEFCNEDTDCVNGLTCESNYCGCSEGKFYDAGTKDCWYHRQYKESCLTNEYCSSFLECDVRAQMPAKNNEKRIPVCLKSFDQPCKNNSECVNFLACVNNKCGCLDDYYPSEELSDCYPKADFGRPCSTNENCKGDFVCDRVYGKCLGALNSRCALQADCSNNLLCLSGYCTCKSDEVLDYESKECRRVVV